MLLSSLFVLQQAHAADNVVVNGQAGAIRWTPDWIGTPNAIFPGLSEYAPWQHDNTVELFSNTSLINYVIGGVSPDSNTAMPVSNNQVLIHGGKVNIAAYGGLSGGGAVFNNSVLIDGGLVQQEVYGGSTEGAGSAYGNSIIINGGTVGVSTYKGNVYGGYTVGTGNAYDNSVVVNGGTVYGSIYGGYSAQGNATGNSIILSKNPILNSGTTVRTDIYGGYAPNGDAFAGNSLYIANAIASKVNVVSNFQYYRFVLPEEPSTPMLQALNIKLTDGASRTATVDYLRFENLSRRFMDGSTYVLLQTDTPFDGSYVANTIRVQKGICLFYDVTVEADSTNTQLVATVVPGSECPNPQVKSLAEGTAASIGFITQGADLLAGQGLQAALASARNKQLDAGQNTSPWVPFAMVGAGSQRIKTGSYVDVSGVSLLAGFSRESFLQENSLLWGLFFETGSGSYDSYNSFGGASTVSGGGDSKYYGAGILGRYEVQGGSLTGVYAEGAVRAGIVDTDFGTSDITDTYGRGINYDFSAAYTGAHVGLGYIWQLADQLDLDLSSKGLWTRQGSDTVYVDGDTIHFEAVDSLRWRNSVYLNYAVQIENGAQLVPYVGLGHEYEFDGKAKSTGAGLTVEAPEMRGGTGIGSVGLRVVPGVGQHVAVDLEVQGYVGQREGTNARLQFKYEF